MVQSREVKETVLSRAGIGFFFCFAFSLWWAAGMRLCKSSNYGRSGGLSVLIRLLGEWRTSLPGLSRSFFWVHPSVFDHEHLPLYRWVAQSRQVGGKKEKKNYVRSKNKNLHHPRWVAWKPQELRGSYLSRTQNLRLAPPVECIDR